jgi:hypothetical protein
MAAGMAEMYTTEVREELAHLAAWLPNERVSVGDVGEMDRHRFIGVSTLAAAVDIEVGQSRESRRGDLRYRSADVVSVSPTAGGEVAQIPDAALGAAIEVSFKRANAILLELRGCRVIRVDDQLQLQERILDRWRDGAWNPKWSVVVEVVAPAATTVLISNGANSSLALSARATLGPSEPFSLADASLGLQTVRNDGVGVELVAKGGATPLLKALRLKKRFWQKEPKVVLEGLDPTLAEDPFGEGERKESMFDLLGED